MSDDDFWGDDEPAAPTAAGPAGRYAQPQPYHQASGYQTTTGVDDFGTDGGGSYDPYDSSELDDLGDFAPRTTPLTLLYAALASASVGLVIGVVLRFMISGRPSGVTVDVAVVGWLLSGVVAVLGVAAYQRQDLASAASMTYAPHPSAALLRLLPLVIGAVGVVLCSWYLADWASRL